MRSIATIVAVLLCAAGGYWALQAALPPTEYPTPAELHDAEQRRPEPPQLQERPDPIEFRWTLQPPEDVMAARTAVEMGETWNATLWANIYHEDYSEIYANIPVGSLSIAALGGAASVAMVSQGEAYGDAIISLVGEDNATIRALAIAWSDPACPFNRFNVFAITASAPGDSEVDYVINGYHMYEIPGQETEYVWDGPTEITAEASIVVSGLYLKCGRTSNPPDDRQLMDFTDQTGADVWYADSETTVTVTCGPCSAQGSLTYSDEEVEIGSNFALGTSMTLNSAPTAETVYARISGIKWGDTPVGGDGVYLYNPGDADDIPNSTVAPGWSRTKTTDNCARALAGSTQELCHLQGTTSPIVFSTQCWAPYILTLTPLDGMFSAEGPAYSIDYTSNCITYTDETTYTVDKFSEAYGPIVQATLSWLYEWEWRRLSSTAIQVRVAQDWREANNEDVGGEDETQNDQRAGMCMWPLTATDRVAAPHWSSGFAIAHLSSIDVNDTYGLPSRASPWEAGAGVTVDPGDNDKWTVTAGASAPAVSRSLLTRYWLRMDRLADHLDDPEAEHNPDWPIMLKANLPITTTLDDPDWWSSATGGVDSEDIFNWAEFSYLRLGITAPRTGTVRLVVDYSVPSVYDPCYTDFTHRFGAEGEWSYTRTRKQVSYDIAVSPGANTALIDLMLPNEHLFPVEGARIQVVDKLTMQLVGNDGDDAEEWTLTELVLVLDPGDGARTEPEVHIEARFKPSWAWGSNWFGFGAVVDGKPSLCYDYGYSSYRGREWGPLYIGHRQHNPESALTDRLDYAKPLATLCAELGYQEGWTSSWPSGGPEASAENKDADDAKVDSSLYWWDIKQSTIDITLSDLEVALCCGTYAIAAGVPYDLRYYKYPRGAVHGILISGDWAGRVRDAVAAVEIWDASDGAWTLIDTVNTDEHGRFAYLGLRELGGPYRIGPDGNALTVINRSYTFDRLLAAISYEPYIDVDECGLTWLVTESDGALRVYYLDARESPEQMEVAQPTALTGYSRPSIAVRGGELLVAATDAAAGNTLLWSSYDRGETWTEVATDLGDGITLGTVAVRPGTGEVILTGIDSSDNVVLRMASDTDLPRDYLTAGVDEITITAAAEGARSTCQAHPDGSLIAAVQGASGVDFFRCRNLATGFVVV